MFLDVLEQSYGIRPGRFVSGDDESPAVEVSFTSSGHSQQALEALLEQTAASPTRQTGPFEDSSI